MFDAPLFCKDFGMSYYSIVDLIRGRRKSFEGWTFVSKMVDNT